MRSKIKFQINVMTENFFSALKTECIYPMKPATISESNALIDDFIYFYKHIRIQLKTEEPPLLFSGQFFSLHMGGLTRNVRSGACITHGRDLF